LLTPQGEVLWSKEFAGEHRLPYFSTTGEVVYVEGGNKVSIYSLTGALLREVSIEDASHVSGTIVVGGGEQVVFVMRDSIVCLNATTSPRIAWGIQLQDYPITRTVYRIDPSRFQVYMDRSVSIVVRTDGLLEYTFDPQALGDSDPVKSPLDYAKYRMYRGPQPNTISLFDGGSVTYTLDLASGALTPREINATPPGSGFLLHRDLLSQRLLFHTPREIRVRQL
jgi:hypothetical protein